MTTLALRTAASYDVLPALRRMIKDNWVLKEVRMDYNTRRLPDWDNVETYPVTLTFEENGKCFDVKVVALSVGYGGAGPTNFSEVLDYFGITYDEDEIFTKTKMGEDGWIRLRYVCG